MPVKVKVAQSCPTLCDPMNYIVHGILQARILEWVAFPFSRGSSQPRDQTQVSPHCSQILYQLRHKRNPGILEPIPSPAKIKHREQTLKAAREKQQIAYTGVSIRPTADLSTETLQTIYLK